MVLGVQETREVFEDFTHWMELLFYFCAAVFSIAFTLGAWVRVRKYRQGRKAGRLDKPLRRVGKAVGLIGTNKTVARRKIKVGLAHGAIFWGFVVLFIGTVILTIDYDIVRNIFGEGARFFHGRFYLVYSFILDTLGGAYLIGLLYMAWRRGIAKPKELDYARVDAKPGSRAPYKLGDWVFWHFLFWLGVGGFLLESLRIVAHDFPSFEIWSPIGWVFARALHAAGLSASTADSLHLGVWWIHAAMALAFIGYIPHSKAMHILTDAANLTFTEQRHSSARLPKQPAGAGAGINEIKDLTWKELLDFDACTKCGRCHVACPAAASGAPLSPRDVILDLRQFAEQQVGMHPFLDWEKREASNGDAVPNIAGGVIGADTLWACTTCMACVEACPVGIEHVPTIVGMRRSLVDQGIMEPSLQDALQNIAQQGNSFGKSSRMRGKWTKDLEFPVKDARKVPVDVLWWVGDYMSFDERLQGLARTLATLLDRAGVDFGILYDGERNSGNDVRRVGEEGLFEMLVEQNVKTLNGARFQQIVTTDPHSLNTLKNEYPDFGGEYTVFHYTEFLLGLLERGALVPSTPLGIKATYHDPCYLGRYNRVTDAPRQILERIGVELIEMPRNKENTFCCGAGGGRIWMDDSKATERPSENRIREATQLEGITHFIVSCPKDVTMYSDAVKTVGVEDALRVVDIVQLVEMATTSGIPDAVTSGAVEAGS